MIIPLKSAVVSYPYGIKNTIYYKGYHTGIDMVSELKTVYAVTAGTVIRSAYAANAGADPTGWGNYCVLRTRDGHYDLLFAHLSKVSASAGKYVSTGSVIGIMGSTGNATGPHLHFEVRTAPWTNHHDVDPAEFLGIKNAIGAVQSINTNGAEIPMLKNIVLCNPGPDERAAGYLADFLQAPVCSLKNVTQTTLDSAEKIFVIGSKEIISPKAVSIVGTDRYDTCRQVIDLCQKK